MSFVYLGRLSAAYEPLSAELRRIRAAGVGEVVRIGPTWRPVVVEGIWDAGEIV